MINIDVEYFMEYYLYDHYEYELTAEFKDFRCYGIHYIPSRDEYRIYRRVDLINSKRIYDRNNLNKAVFSMNIPVTREKALLFESRLIEANNKGVFQRLYSGSLECYHWIKRSFDSPFYKWYPGVMDNFHLFCKLGMVEYWGKEPLNDSLESFTYFLDCNLFEGFEGYGLSKVSNGLWYSKHGSSLIKYSEYHLSLINSREIESLIKEIFLETYEDQVEYALNVKKRLERESVLEKKDVKRDLALIDSYIGLITHEYDRLNNESLQV